MLILQEDKDRIIEVLGESIIIEIYKANEKIWSCAGMETEFSKKYNICASFGNMEVEHIIHEIFKILGASKQ